MGSTGKQGEPPAGGGQPSILLVDDDIKQRDQYQIRLERKGYRVRVVPGADAAMEAVSEERPDVVVLDIAMPERDGLSALQELLDRDPGLPVVIHTAYPSYADSFLAWAADAYVVKSQDITPLLEAVATAISGESPDAS